MKSIAFANGTVVLHDRLLDDGMVCCEDSMIHYVGQRKTLPGDVEIIDAKGGVIAPGFIDLHVHGGAGADFMDGTPEAVSPLLDKTIASLPGPVSGAAVDVTDGPSIAKATDASRPVERKSSTVATPLST